MRVDERELTPKQRYRQKKRILRITWPGSGRQKQVWEFTDEEHYQRRVLRWQHSRLYARRRFRGD